MRAHVDVRSCDPPSFEFPLDNREVARFIRSHTVFIRVAKQNQGVYLRLSKLLRSASLRNIHAKKTLFQDYMIPDAASGHRAYKPFNRAKSQRSECTGAYEPRCNDFLTSMGVPDTLLRQYL